LIDNEKIENHKQNGKNLKNKFEINKMVLHNINNHINVAAYELVSRIQNVLRQASNCFIQSQTIAN